MVTEMKVQTDCNDDGEPVIIISWFERFNWEVREFTDFKAARIHIAKLALSFGEV